MSVNYLRISHERFVTAYMEAYIGGTTMNDLAKQLDVPVEYARSKSSHLRKRGINLPFLVGQQGQRFDEAGLNAIVTKFTKEIE